MLRNGTEINDGEMGPMLSPIKNGWAARGRGWAVHGRTKEEAIEKFRLAEIRHREIDARPFWYKRHPEKGHHNF